MRRFATTALFFLAVSAHGLEGFEIFDDLPGDVPHVSRVRSVTSGLAQHFVGYYGVTPWNASGEKLFCMESTFGDRLPNAGEKAAVCLIDLKTGRLTRVAETSAWNLQQGAMLQWSPAAPDRLLTFNDRVDGKLVSVVLDVTSGKRSLIPRPLTAISPDGKAGLSINYDRLRRIRPVTGYAGGDARLALVNRPADDGLFSVDVQTGASKLLVSVSACCEKFPPPKDLADQPFWLEHALFSRVGSRIFLIARAFDPHSRQLVSIPLTVSPDGSNLDALMPWAEQGASHYDWLDGHRLALTRQQSPGAWSHLLFDTTVPAGNGCQRLAPKVLTRDGHCSFSPDGKWMVTDTYPDERRRQNVYLMNVATGTAARVASFAEPPEFHGDWRCDLHPRWDRESKRVCIDSTHGGSRQVYVLDLRLP